VGQGNALPETSGPKSFPGNQLIEQLEFGNAWYRVSQTFRQGLQYALFAGAERANIDAFGGQDLVQRYHD
jgi:hypothetical protein